MQSMISLLEMTTCSVDGCAVGLQAAGGLGLHYKPWRIEVMVCVQELVNILSNRTCSGDHPHVPVAGELTRASESYPLMLCRLLLRGISTWALRIQSTVTTTTTSIPSFPVAWQPRVSETPLKRTNTRRLLETTLG